MTASAGRPKRILFIVENLPVPFDRRVWQEATTLKDAGYEISIICPTGKGYEAKYELLEGIHIYRHSLPLEAKKASGYALEYCVHKNHIGFFISGSSSVNFAIDTVPPTVSVLSVENKIYNMSDVPLNFAVSEPASKISYVLDNQDNVTINGNITLTGLSAGLHNVTVYAWDIVGNVGVSETIFFTIAEPPELFPTTIVIAPVALLSVIGSGLVFYFKKRKGRST